MGLRRLFFIVHMYEVVPITLGLGLKGNFKGVTRHLPLTFLLCSEELKLRTETLWTVQINVHKNNFKMYKIRMFSLNPPD